MYTRCKKVSYFPLIFFETQLAKRKPVAYNLPVAKPSIPKLGKLTTSGGSVIQMGPSTWRLEVPAGSSRKYRLAQLDDYADLGRKEFPWQPPLKLSLRCRASSQVIPGTWGFGFWNDPFGMTIVRGTQLRLPVLPNAAWFFFASPQNHISLREDLPGDGQMGATFRSPKRLPIRLALGISLLPLLLLPPVVRWLRNLAKQYVRQDAIVLNHDPTTWHLYELEWRTGQIGFYLDGHPFLHTVVVPHSPLGLVIWIDNQYASLPPDGHLGYGTLGNEKNAWIEVDGLKLTIA